MTLVNATDTELMNELLDAVGHRSSPDELKHKLPYDTNQAFISDFLSEFDRIKGRSIKQEFKNLLMLEPVPSSTFFFNKMMSIDKGQSLLENVPRSIMGDLQPYFKFYLTYGMGGEYREYPLRLNNFDGFTSMTESRAGLGVGLRSFSWVYEGTHPGDIQHNIRCKLKLYFESPEAFFHVYKNAKTSDEYNFASLIYRRAPRNSAERKYARESLENYGRGYNSHLNYNQNDHRVKIEIGYSLPADTDRIVDAYAEQGYPSNAQAAATNFREALRENKTVLYLTMIRHTFLPIFSSSDFSFELDIDFQGSIEAAITTKEANILIRKNKEYEKRRQKLEEKRKELKAAITAMDHVQPELRKEILSWDISGYPGSDKDSKTAIKKEYYSLLGLEPVKKGHEDFKAHNENVDTINKFLQHRNKQGNQNRKFDFSESSRLDVNSRITCDLNEDKKIYNLEIKKKDLTKYFNDRDSISAGLASEKMVEEAKRRIALLGNSQKDMELKSKLKSIARKHTASRSVRSTLFTKFAEEHFRDKKGSTFQSGQQKIRNKMKKFDKAKLKEAALAENENISSTEYRRYVKHTLNPGSETGKKTHVLFWLYYGDLLDAVLEVIDDKKAGLDLFRGGENEDGVFKIVLGNIEYLDGVTNKPSIINIAKVPISLDLWEDFWFKYVVQKGSMNYYLKDFLKDSLSFLIPAALTNRHRMLGEPGINFFASVQEFSVPHKKLYENHQVKKYRIKNDKSYYIEERGGRRVAKDLFSDEIMTTKDQRILFLFNGRDTFGIGSRKGDKDRVDDNNNGIYHIVLGQQNTPIYNVSFSKAEIPYWLEWTAFKNGQLQENVHLSEPYHCSIELPGLSFIRPGAYLYIRFPISWLGSPQISGTPARALGLGGYFLISSTSHSLVLLPSGGKLDWRTTATAIWESFGNTTRTAATPARAAP